MESAKPALVLLHGLTASGRAWQDVAPLLSAGFRVYAPTAPGHRGGPAARHPATAADLVDWAAKYLDDEGLDWPNLVGHSMGGFLAVELARRGRAASVCAFAPGGFWGDQRATILARVGRGQGAARALRPAFPLMLRSAAVRRLWFRDGACHGDRVSAVRGTEIFDDFLGCTVAREIFATDDQQIAPMDPLPCPITGVWSERDQINTRAVCDPVARQILPHASFETLPDVGHDPMMDDPQLVAQTILRVTPR
jgi:pimeloyl-ACP methyl ester carboxylesterase